MGSRWCAELVDAGVPGGWALAASPEGFLSDANGVLFPREWLKRQELARFDEHGLGQFDGQPVFLLQADQPFDLPGAHWQGLRQFMMHADAEQFQMLAYASQIGTWASQHRFCGRCGARMQRHAGERAMHCVECGLHQYPRISPSMAPRPLPSTTTALPARQMPNKPWLPCRNSAPKPSSCKAT